MRIAKKTLENGIRVTWHSLNVLSANDHDVSMSLQLNLESHGIGKAITAAMIPSLRSVYGFIFEWRMEWRSNSKKFTKIIYLFDGFELPATLHTLIYGTLESHIRRLLLFLNLLRLMNNMFLGRNSSSSSNREKKERRRQKLRAR